MSISEAQVWFALTMSSCVSLVGALLLATFMNRSHRHTFYSHRPFACYVDELWEKRKLLHLSDGTVIVGHDASRGD